jgi:prevent-host-death family protein
MISFAASDLKNKTGSIFMAASRAPVRITKRGTEGFVVMTESQFAAFEAMEDRIWGERAMEAQKNGEMVGPENAMRLLNELSMQKLGYIVTYEPA